jgi:hypothetical protein
MVVTALACPTLRECRVLTPFARVACLAMTLGAMAQGQALQIFDLGPVASLRGERP